MSLGYPSQTPLQYNPFIKTSFGFGTNALQNLPNNPFPNATDYVRVVITVDDATHWDDSGHIQTAEVGTAVSSYSSESFIWEVEGERNDVETILAELVFYPPAYQPLTDWQPTALKENDTAGNYSNEEPADTAAVPDTYMEIFVYNATNQVTAYDIYIEAVNPIYNNPRPYFSSSVQTIDVAGSGFMFQGDLLPLNLVIEHTDSEEILEVKSEFIRTTDGTQYTGTAYGLFTDYQDIYIGGKKGIPQNTTDKRFNFIGKKDECNAFLEFLNFTTYTASLQSPAAHSFFLRTSISDGQIGSYVDTLVWHSDTYPRDALPSLPNLSFTEDITAYWDFGDITFYNLDEMGEVDTYSVKVKLQFGGLSTSGAEQFYTTTTVDNQSRVDAPDGQGNYETIYTITDSDLNTILTALRNLVFVPKRDYNANFTIGYAWEFSSTEYQTIYTSQTYRTTIVNGTATPELSNTNSTHTFVEDFRYDLSSGNVPQIVHPHNDDFQIQFIVNQPGSGNIKTFNTSVTFQQIAEGHTKFSGTKNEINAALNQAYFAPNPDVNGTVSFTIALERLSGNLEFEQTTIAYITFIAGNRPELTLSNPGPLNWEEDVSLIFDSGIDIVDDATTQLYLPAYGTEYTAIVRLRDPYGNQFTDGVVTSPNKGLLTSHNNYGDIFTMTGSRSAINACLQTIKFIPKVDYEGRVGYVDDTYVHVDYVEYKDFYVDFHIERNYDSVVLMNYTYQIFFNPPTIHDEYSFTPSIQDWSEDVSKVFDTSILVTDLSCDNPDLPSYQTDYTVYMKMVEQTYVEEEYVDVQYSIYGDYNFGYLTSTSTGGAVGSAGGSNPKSYTGSKNAVNQAIANMKYVPDVDVTGSFCIEFKIVRDFDGAVLADYDQTRQITFNTATGHDEYSFNQEYIIWYEDIPKAFDSGLRITDLATDNPDISNYYQTNYQIKAHAKWWDGNTAHALDNHTWATTSYGSATVSGLGIVSDPLTIIGSKADCNTALANLLMTPEPEFNNSPAINGEFWFEYEIERLQDNVKHVSYNVNTTFAAGIGHDEFLLPQTTYYVKDNTASINTTSNPLFNFHLYNKLISGGQIDYWFIGDQLGDANTQTYDLNISISDVGNLHYGTSLVQEYYMVSDFVESDYSTNEVKVSGTRSSINSNLATLNYFNDDQNREVNVKLTRHVDSKVLFDVDHEFEFLEIPEISSFTYNNICDIYDTTNDNIVANYTYSGDDSVIGGTDSPSIIVTTSYINSSKSSEIADDDIRYNVGGNLEYTFDNIDRVNDTVTFDRVSSSALKHPTYQKLDIHMNKSRVRSKPFTIEKDYYSLYDTSSTKAWIFPYSVGFRPSASDSNVLDTQFFHYYDGGGLWEQRSYTFGVSGTSSKSIGFYDTGQYRNYDQKKNRLEDFLLVELVHSNTAPSYYFDILQVTPFVDNSASTLVRDTSNSVVVSTTTTGEFSIIEDTIIHDNKLWIYVHSNNLTGHHIFSVDLNSDNTLSSTPNPTLHKTFQKHPDRSYVSFGVADNELFYVVSTSNYDIGIYHQNTGGTNNFGLHTTISKSDWDQTVSSNQGMSADYDNRWIKGNKSGYITVGSGLYYYSNNTWNEVVDASLYPPHSIWNVYPNYFQWGVLTKDYYFNPNSNKIMKLNGLNTPTEVIDITTLPSGYNVSKLEGNRNFNTVVLQDTQDNIYILSLT